MRVTFLAESDDIWAFKESPLGMGYHFFLGEF
jgi:hypothetical protein